MNSNRNPNLRARFKWIIDITISESGHAANCLFRGKECQRLIKSKINIMPGKLDILLLHHFCSIGEKSVGGRFQVCGRSANPFEPRLAGRGAARNCSLEQSTGAGRGTSTCIRAEEGGGQRWQWQPSNPVGVLGLLDAAFREGPFFSSPSLSKIEANWTSLVRPQITVQLPTH